MQELADTALHIGYIVRSCAKALLKSNHLDLQEEQLKPQCNVLNRQHTKALHTALLKEDVAI